jgi:hypothetical protein
MGPSPSRRSDFEAVQNTMRALLAVPTKEIDEHAGKWTRRKNKDKKASPGHIVT